MISRVQEPFESFSVFYAPSFYVHTKSCAFFFFWLRLAAFTCIILVLRLDFNLPAVSLRSERATEDGKHMQKPNLHVVSLFVLLNTQFSTRYLGL